MSCRALRVKSVAATVAASLVLCVSQADIAIAAKKSTNVVVDQAQIGVAPLNKKGTKTVQCYRVEKKGKTVSTPIKYKSGTEAKDLTVTLKKKIRKLKTTDPDKAAKFKKRLRKLKKACKKAVYPAPDPNDPGNPNDPNDPSDPGDPNDPSDPGNPGEPEPEPSPTPTPVADFESLDPLDRPLTADDVRYLQEKAGFGGDNPDLKALINQGLFAVIDEFMRYETEDTATTIRINNWLDNDLTNPDTPLVPRVTGVRRALLDLAINSKNPFRMRMLHWLIKLFSVDGSKLQANSGSNDPNSNNPRQDGQYWEYIDQLLSRIQNLDMVRILQNVAIEPAVLISHDHGGSVVLGPNRNFARQLLDRIVTGTNRIEGGEVIPNYNEVDLKAVARRLTGWSVDLVDTGVLDYRIWAAVYSFADHAPGPETIFAGNSYSFESDTERDLLDSMTRRHPGTAENWARLLLREFVTLNPPQGLVDRLAAEIKSKNYNLEGPLRTLLASKAFYYQGYKNTIPKNPLEFMVGAIKFLNMEELATQELSNIDNDIARRSKDNNTAEVGMGYDVTRPPTPDFYPEERFLGGGALAANCRFIARLMERGEDEAEQASPIWTESDALPSPANVDAEDLIEILTDRLGITLTDEQKVAALIYMEITIGQGLTEYDNSDVDDRRLKGLGMLQHLLCHPEAVLK